MTLLPLGLHFRLPQEAYLRDPGLGSTSLKALAADPLRYWWDSPLNPARDTASSDSYAKTLGEALHTLIYLGEAEFDAKFVRGPNIRPDLAPSAKAAITKKANEDAAAVGKEALKWHDYDRTVIAWKVITDDPGLKDVFRNGVAEVSFFWEEDGVRMRSRFDYVKAYRRRLPDREVPIVAIGDLKSVGNHFEKQFDIACHWAVRDHGYDVQAAHYVDAMLHHVPQAIKEGRLFGKKPSDEFLAIMAAPSTVAWQWVFLATKGPPEVDSLILSPGNPQMEEGRQIASMAKDNYRQCMKQFGTNAIWKYPKKPREFEQEMLYRRR